MCYNNNMRLKYHKNRSDTIKSDGCFSQGIDIYELNLIRKGEIIEVETKWTD